MKQAHDVPEPIEKLGNLTTRTHERQNKADHNDSAKEGEEGDPTLPSTSGSEYSCSAEIMVEFLEKGRLKLIIELTPNRRLQCGAIDHEGSKDLGRRLNSELCFLLF